MNINEIRQKIQDLLDQLAAEDNPQPDPYAELKKAHAEGKVIQSNIFGEWVDIKQGNSFVDITPCYLRIKPEEPNSILTPKQVSEGWIEWHGEENPVPGKRVNMLFRDGMRIDARSESYHWDKYRNNPIIAYRVIEPKLVPLGPEDVPILSVLRYIRTPIDEYAVTSKVAGELKSYVMGWTYGTLMGLMEINRSIPLTGKWDAAAWGPCSKEASS